MTERKNLPAVIAAQAVAVLSEQRGSLVGRGLAALRKDNDALYRQARAVFDRNCDLLSSIGYWSTAAISSAFKIFQRLADENYGKAYYPLSIIYGGHNDIEDGDSHAKQYEQLALEWCLDNQDNDDAELWCDFGLIYWSRQDREQAKIFFRKAAAKGDARGQWLVGACLDMLGEQGNYWRELAAKQGNSRMQTELASLYESFPPEQYQKAAHWYRMAAKQGDEVGQFNLGRMYEKGLGVDQDDEQFVYWTRKAAEQGYEPGQWELGRMFSEGRGVEKNGEQAEYWYCKAAEQGDEERQKELGYMYSEGRGVAQDYEQAEYWFSKADWPPYEISAHYYYEIPPNDEQAVYWLRKAAEQGDEYGQWELGEMFANGRGVAQDNEQAEYWFRKAAEQDYSSYQNELGEMYKEGRGVSQDDKQAVYWFSKAAEQGDEDGQFNLGMMYEEGCGVGQDDEQAVYWYRKAAEQGDARGQWKLGCMYSKGRGVAQDGESRMTPQGRKIWGSKMGGQLLGRMFNNQPKTLMDEYLVKQLKKTGRTQNDEQAVYWFRKAAEQGNADAQEALRKLGID